MNWRPPYIRWRPSDTKYFSYLVPSGFRTTGNVYEGIIRITTVIKILINRNAQLVKPVLQHLIKLEIIKIRSEARSFIVISSLGVDQTLTLITQELFANPTVKVKAHTFSSLN